MYKSILYIFFLGITSNLVFIAIVCMMSWYQIINSEEYLQYLESLKDGGTKTFKDFDSDGKYVKKMWKNFICQCSSDFTIFFYFN